MRAERALRETFRSMAGFTWSMTLFGARQIENLVTVDPGRAGAAFDALEATLRSQLGAQTEPVLDLGDRLQAGLVDRLLDGAAAAVGSADLLSAALGLGQRLADLGAAFPEQAPAWLELSNKLCAFHLFHDAETRLGPPSVRGLSWPERVARADRLGPYDGLWVREGLAFARTERAWRCGGAPRGLLTGSMLPGGILNVLHPGVGTSLAARLFTAGDPGGSDRRLRVTVERFLTLCEENAAEGFRSVACESMGIAIRNLYPSLTSRVGRHLEAIAAELRDYYWHGVGRALYFAPSHLPPGRTARARALRAARQEPPHQAGRANALAGLAWALTLVNFRRPEVLASFLEDHAAEIFDRRAFSNGVSSAAMIWYGVNGREAYLEGCLGHRPRAGRPAVLLWQRLVTEPVERALAGYADLERRGSLATLYRCPSTADLRPGETSEGGLRATGGRSPGLFGLIDGAVSRTVQAFGSGSGGGDADNARAWRSRQRGVR